MELKAFATQTQASNAAAEFVATAIESALATASDVVIALSGGTTPQHFLEHLGGMDIPWQHIRVTLTDERQVPADHAESNYRLLRETLFAGRVPESVFMALTEENLAECASLPLIPLLGMGTDGHFASIFADAPQLSTLLDPSGDQWVAAVATQASPYLRTTLTMKSLDRCKQAGLLVFGDTKRQLLADADAFPVGRLLDQLQQRLQVFWAP